MIKILIAVIVVIIMFLVNKMCMKKNKYFFPIIPFIISCVIIGISIFQIVQKENEYAADEIQPVAIEESGFEYERYICGIKHKKDCRIGDKFTKATILLLFSFTN